MQSKGNKVVERNPERFETWTWVRTNQWHYQIQNHNKKQIKTETLIERMDRWKEKITKLAHEDIFWK